MADEDPGPTGVTEPRARVLRWGAAIVVLVGATIVVTVWRAVPVESAVGWMLAAVVVFSLACGGLMVRRAGLTPPESGEELEVWSLHPDGRGPLLVRQADGTWWAASGSLY